VDKNSNQEFLAKTLEEAFFFRMDQDVITALQRKLTLNDKLKAFQDVTGIRNKSQLLGLIDAGFDLPTLIAFTWVPLVYVAWADGQIDPQEKTAIFKTLNSKGISPETVALMTDHEWFRQRPDNGLWNIWRQFTAAVMKHQPTDLRNELMDEIVTLCYVVANASGGAAGAGAVSERESRVVDGVAQSFSDSTTEK
jgi:tellurite resistance protein